MHGHSPVQFAQIRGLSRVGPITNTAARYLVEGDGGPETKHRHGIVESETQVSRGGGKGMELCLFVFNTELIKYSLTLTAAWAVDREFFDPLAALGCLWGVFGSLCDALESLWLSFGAP